MIGGPTHVYFATINDEQEDHNKTIHIIHIQPIEQQHKNLIDFFYVVVELDDLHFHPMLNGNKRHNISNVETLKVVVTN